MSTDARPVHEAVNAETVGVACEKAFLFGLVKRVSRERASERRNPSLTRSREVRFAYPNRRACSQATVGEASRAPTVDKRGENVFTLPKGQSQTSFHFI